MQALPESLTRELLLELMRDERYLNPNRPEHAAYARMISDGFKRLYGDAPAQADATGRLGTSET